MMEKPEFQEMIRKERDADHQPKSKPISWKDKMYKKIFYYILKRIDQQFTGTLFRCQKGVKFFLGGPIHFEQFLAMG
jgi:hypothetical protein